MAGGEATIAAAALAIALVALITAVGQLLQQYFATADGYRRCHKSVMGEYARRTRLHWRWREFRFETLYTTPEIFLMGDGAPIKHGQVLLTGSDLSREKSLIPVSSLGKDMQVSHDFSEIGHLTQIEMETAPQRKTVFKKRSKTTEIYRGEMACWVPFLHWLHEKTFTSLDTVDSSRDPESWPPPKMRLPAIIFRERSWDFQPPDVVRPLAKTSLSDIAVLARRMGMKWKDFRPSDGILRAEGHSQIITSTVVRSLGIVLQFTYTGQGLRLRMAEQNLRRNWEMGSIIPEQEEIYIPRARADRLGCGVIRTETKFGLPDFTVSTQPEIVKAISFLDRSGTSAATLTQLLHDNPDFQMRVADLVALTTPPARRRGSSLVQVPAPSDNMCGVTTSSIGRRAFRLCLEEYIVKHPDHVGLYTEKALLICQDIGTRYAAWDHTDDYAVQDEQWVVTRDPRYLDEVHHHLFELTNLLHGWEQQHAFRYINILAIHIRVAMLAPGGETSPLRNNGSDYKADVDGYFRLLSKIVDEMEQKRGFSDRKLIVDAWVSMMLRAFCWGACHFFVPGERVPIQYFGSQLPVYIG